MISEKFLWAKKNPDKSILVHLIETGCIAQCLLQHSVLYPVANELLKCSTLTREELISLVGYVVSLHDIGKIHPLFLAKDEETKIELENYGILFSDLYASFRHEKYSAFLAEDFWRKRGFSLDFYDCVKNVLRYHHQGKSGLGEEIVGLYKEDWKEWQIKYENILFEQFRPIIDFNVTNWDVFCECLLGLTIVSDWIASGNVFEYTIYRIENDEDLFNEVKKNVKEKMLAFLDANMLTHREESFHIQSFDDLWKTTINHPRPIQKDAEFIMNEEKLPLAVILEAPMGEGKTEAALYMAYRMAEYWNKEGFYVALPTAATSNQMHERVNTMLSMFGSTTSKLMHGMAWAIDDFTNAEEFRSSDNDNVVTLWTAPMRRGLIAPYAVGTVDQVMLAVMFAKYAVLRLLGLTSKVLIIDELHSYDVYMSEILVTLLSWCKVLHIPVIMLSATLPKDKKELFAKCYKRGKTKVLSSDKYPCYTLFYDDAEVKEYPSSNSRSSATVGLRMEPWYDNTGKVVDFIAEKARKFGGYYCILRNTVKSAQETYRIFKEKNPDIRVILFHARFTANRRQEIEQLCLSTFGKGASRNGTCVLIATQVVEQSLDVDFDYMVIDFCPIDLLLQRIGRERRHDNVVRPVGLNREVVVLTSSQKYPIYDELIMWRTAEVLRNKIQIVLPDDIPVLVQEIYDKEKLEQRYREKFIEHQINESMESGVARNETIGKPDKETFSFADRCVGFFNDDDIQFSAKTRLGDESITLALISNEELFNRIKLCSEKESGCNVTKADAKEVLLQSVSVSSKKVIKILLEKTFTNAFCGSGLLSNVFVLLMQDGRCQLDDICIYNNDEMGVIVERS